MATDEDLALGIKQGHRDCLQALVERHHSPLLGFLYRMSGGDRSLAEDMVQETFLRVLRTIDQYQHLRPFKPWLYTIATNLIRDYYRRFETRAQVDLSEQKLSQMADSDPIEDDLQAADEAKAIAAALLSLPAHQREVVVLRYYQELPLAEISAILDIPVGTVKSRLSIGLGRLRAVLEKEIA